MGLFNKKKSKSGSTSKYQWMTVDEALAFERGESRVSNDTVAKLAGELCDQMNFLRTQQADTKDEYNQITQYLSDLQRFEMLDERNRAAILDSARMILSIDSERIKFQTGDKRITMSQYHTMEMYENDFPDKLNELRKHEDYLNLVRNDMRNIEGEKGSIIYGKESAEGKLKFLHKLSYAIIFIVLLIFIVLIVLADHTGKDFVVPFFLTGLAAIVYMVYYMFAVSACKTDSKKNDYMLNRANVLLNKVKIKYVNTTNVLDYAYDKYGVNSVQELSYVWENYVLQKAEEKRYLKNTQLMNAYSEKMQEILENLGMEKADAWVHLPEVFLDRGEYADFHDAVSRRRNKLRAQLDYNMRQQDTVMNEIQALKRKHTRQEALINSVLSRNGIED